MYHGHAGPALSADISPDGRQIVSVGMDGTVRRWRIDGGDGVVIRRDPGGVWLGRYAADGHTFMIASDVGTVLLDPDAPALSYVTFPAWLAAATSAVVDDSGRIGSDTRGAGR